MSDNVAAQGDYPNGTAWRASIPRWTANWEASCMARDDSGGWMHSADVADALRAAYDRGWNDGAGAMA